MMKRSGASIIFINSLEQVLLFLRDDRPDIPYPGMWDVPGGHVEERETPEACIAREMREEMEMDLEDFSHFSVVEFPDRVEHTFWKKTDLDIEKIRLHEGQRLKWFSRDEVRRTELALGFNRILEDFFQQAPYREA